MEAIKELQNQGYKLSLIGEDIRCQKLESANPDPIKVNQLLKQIKANKAEAVRYLKKRFSYDPLLQDAIGRLNAAGVRLTDTAEKDRRLAFDLAIQLTKAANQGDVETFKQLVNQWQELFLGYARAQGEIDSILCPYKGIERPVHSEVCKWHRAMNDPECKGCDQSKRRVLH